MAAASTKSTGVVGHFDMDVNSSTGPSRMDWAVHGTEEQQEQGRDGKTWNLSYTPGGVIVVGIQRTSHS